MTKEQLPPHLIADGDFKTLLGLRTPVPSGREAIHEPGIRGSPAQGTRAGANERGCEPSRCAESKSSYQTGRLVGSS
jgi:hypothetical protein